jgi:hypothetical protein
VGPRAVLDAAAKIKIPSPRTSIIQPVAQRYITELSWALVIFGYNTDI